MTVRVEYTPPAPVVDDFEQRDMLRLMKQFLIAFRDTLTEIKAIAPAFEIPQSAIDLRSLVQEIQDKYDALRP